MKSQRERAIEIISTAHARLLSRHELDEIIELIESETALQVQTDAYTTSFTYNFTMLLNETKRSSFFMEQNVQELMMRTNFTKVVVKFAKSVFPNSLI